MKWAIDQIINNIAILENIKTSEKIEINTNLLPLSSHEGAILIFKNGIYSLDETEEEKRRRLIEEKFKRLKDITQ